MAAVSYTNRRYYYHKEDTLYPKQAGTPSFKSNPHFVGAQT